MLVAQEGVWTATREEDFEDTTYYRWEDLRDEDVFVRLYAMAGNRKRKKAAMRQVLCD